MLNRQIQVNSSHSPVTRLLISPRWSSNFPPLLILPQTILSWRSTLFFTVLHPCLLETFSPKCHICHFLCPLTILGGVSLSCRMPSLWSGRISLECIPGKNVFSSFTHVTTFHWVCISQSVQCLGLKYGVTWFVPDSTLLHDPTCHTPVYTGFPSTMLCTKVGMPITHAYSLLLFLSSRPPFQSSIPSKNLSSFPISSQFFEERPYICGYPCLHSSLNNLLSQVSWFMTRNCIHMFSLSSKIRYIATQVFSLAMISSGRNSEREEGIRGRRKHGRRERNKPKRRES